VEVGEGVGHLVDIDGAAALQEGAVICKLLVKLTLSGKLEHEGNALLIMEVAVEAEHVGMSEVMLDRDFVTDLLLDSGSLVFWGCFGKVEDSCKASSPWV
jgi:hypothetical protein